MVESEVRHCLILSLYYSGIYPIFICFLNNIFYSFFVPSSANLQSRVKKGKMTQEKFEKTMSLLKGVLDYESFKDVDMVIEVVQHTC